MSEKNLPSQPEKSMTTSNRSAGPMKQVTKFKRSGEKASVGTDLLEGGNVERLIGDLASRVGIEETQMVEARVGGIENAEAILSWLNLKKRCHFAVDAIQVAVELLNPDRDVPWVR